MTKRTLIRKTLGKICLTLGLYNEYKQIDTERINRLIFVCRGNVCRSPYAEVAAKKIGILSSSCGVDVTRSSLVENMALEAAFLRGKDLSRHLSRSIYDLHLEKSDCLVVFDPSHLPSAKKVAERVGCQITLISLWRNIPAFEIADPYGKSLQAFSACYDEIDEALGRLVTLLSNLHPHGSDLS